MVHMLANQGAGLCSAPLLHESQCTQLADEVTCRACCLLLLAHYTRAMSVIVGNLSKAELVVVKVVGGGT